MKKSLFVTICCLCLCCCGEKNDEIINNSNYNNDSTDENEIQSNYVDIDNHKLIKDYSTALVEELNNTNNDNILKYNNTTFEQNIYFVKYNTADGTSFTIRFNNDYELIGITIQNPNFEEYTNDFIQLKAKYLSLTDFYDDCSKINKCSNIMIGTDSGSYKINGIEISNSNSIKNFSTRDINK